MRDTVARMRGRNADVLLMDGRNSRERLQNAGAYVQTAAELLLYCDAKSSARRLVHARGEPEYDPRRVELARREIIGRRVTDRTRDQFPYHDPEHMVQFHRRHRRDPHRLIIQSYAAPTTALPCAIRLDTTRLSKERMTEDAKLVARAGLDLLQS
jgi:hypothetical protein